MIKLECYLCGGDAYEATEDFDFGHKDYKVIVQGVKVRRCTRCGEGTINEEELARMIELCRGLYQLDESERPSVANINQ